MFVPEEYFLLRFQTCGKTLRGEERLVSDANGPLLPRLDWQKVSKIPLKTGDDTNDTNCVRFHKVGTIYL